MMSVKKMVDLYVSFGLYEETWRMLFSMTSHGLISYDNWIKFYNKCHSWTWCDDEEKLVNGQNTIIDGDGNLIYYYDENGCLVKA